MIGILKLVVDLKVSDIILKRVFIKREYRW